MRPGALRLVAALGAAGLVAIVAGPLRSAVSSPADENLPDIYYLIPDRYPREDTLAEMFDFDNSAWIAALEARGFQVSDQALANYPSTRMSLAATWNLAPVDALVEVPEEPDDWGPVEDLLANHRLGHTLVDAGYDYVHMGSWWAPTAKVPFATENLRLSRHDDVRVSELLQVTGLHDAEGNGPSFDDLTWQQGAPLHTMFQWQELKRLADEQYEPRDKPRFVLAHITVPHEPYVFDADGSFVTAKVAASRTREDNFLRQVQYVNHQVDDLLDRLLAGPREDWPIIVIQSDEGPHPAAKTSSDYNWLTASTDERREKLQIFSAILMHAESDLELPEDLVSINTWRHILDELLGTGLGPIDAPVVIYDPARLYEFVNVTDEVRR